MFAVLQGAACCACLCPVRSSWWCSRSFFRPHSISRGWELRSWATSRPCCPRCRCRPASGLPIDRLLLGAAAVFLVSFAAGIVTARSFGARGGYPVDADREMVGFGAANIGGGPVRRFPGHRLRFADGDQRQCRRQVAARRHRGGRGTARDRALPAAGAGHPADPGPRRHTGGGGAQPHRCRRADASSGGSAAWSSSSRSSRSGVPPASAC